jgi:hypothetical protein
MFREGGLERMQELGGSWRERRERLYEALERRVDIVRGLRSRIEQAPVDIAPPEMNELLNGVRNEMYALLPPETREAVKQIEELSAKLEKLDGKIRALETDEDADGGQITGKLVERLFMQQQLYDLETDEAVFAENVEGILKSLARKYVDVRRLRRDRASVGKAFEKASGKGMAVDAIIDIRYSAVDATIVLESDEYAQVSGSDDSYGTHFSDTPFSIVRARGAEDLEETVRHERVHNLLDGAGTMWGRTSAKAFESSLAELEKEAGRKGHEGRGSDIEGMLKDIGLEPSNLVDSVHEELLAELENAEASGFGYPLAVRDQVLSEGASSEEGREKEEKKKEILLFQKVSGSFATAGEQLQNLVAHLEEVEEKAGGAEFTAQVGSLADGVRFTFLRAIEHLRTASEVAKFLDDADVLDDAHALAAILKPSRYRHIVGYLERRFGKERVTEARQAADLGRTFTPELERLSVLVSGTQDGSRPLTAPEKRALNDVLERRWVAGSVAAVPLSDVKEYERLLRLFGEEVGARQVVIDSLVERTNVDSLARAVETAREDEATLTELARTLDGDGRKQLGGVLAWTLRTEDWGLDEARASAFWPVVVELGIEPVITKLLEEEE